MVDTTAQPTSLDRRRVLRRRIGVLLVAIAGIVATAWHVMSDPYSCELSEFGSIGGTPHLSLVPFGPTCTAVFGPQDVAPRPTSPEPLWSVLLLSGFIALAATATQLVMTRGINIGDETVASQPNAMQTTILPSTTTWRYRRRHFTNWIIAGALFPTMLTAIPYTLKYLPDRVDGRRWVWTHWDSAFVAALGLAPGIAVGLTAATVTLVLRSRTAVSRRSDFAGIGAATACYFATLIVIVVAQFSGGDGRVGVKYYSIPLVSALMFAGVGALVWRSLRPPHSSFSGDSPFGLAGDAAGEVGDHQLEERP